MFTFVINYLFLLDIVNASDTLYDLYKLHIYLTNYEMFAGK